MTPRLDRIPLLAALPTGALLPQTHGSRTAAEVENAGAGAQKGSEKIETDGNYGEEGFIYQALSELPVFDGNHAVVGSWIVGGESAGIGVREDDTPVTGNLSRFVPHYFE